MKTDKWLLNEENDRRFAIAKKNKRGYILNLICDICGNETDKNHLINVDKSILNELGFNIADVCCQNYGRSLQ